MKFAKDEHGLLGLDLPCGWISFNDEDSGSGKKRTFVSNLTRAARVIARAVSDGQLLNRNGCVSDFMNQLAQAGLPESISLIMESVVMAPCAAPEELAKAGILIEEYPHSGIASPLPHLYLRHPQITGVELWHVEQAVEILHQNASLHGYGLSFLQALRIAIRLIALEAPKDHSDFERRVRLMPDAEFNAWVRETTQRAAKVNSLLKNLFLLRRPSRLQ